MRLLNILKILSFHSFNYFSAACSTYSHLHHRLPNSFKAATISSLHLMKSILEGNLYFGPLEIIFRILESGIIFKFQVVIWPAAG